MSVGRPVTVKTGSTGCHAASPHNRRYPDTFTCCTSFETVCVGKPWSTAPCNFLIRCTTASAIALFYYDYVLTLTSEINWIWLSGSDFSWISLLFLTNRYINFLGYVPIFFDTFLTWKREDTMSSFQRCVALYTFHQVILLLTQVISGLIIIIRIYALYDRNKAILALLLVVGFAGVGYAAHHIVLFNISMGREKLPASLPVIRDSCILLAKHDQLTNIIITYVWLLVHSFLAFVLSLCKIIRHMRECGSVVLKVILRDDLAYFAIMCAMWLSVIFWHVSALEGTGDVVALRGLTLLLTNSFTSSLVSRLILNLRNPTLIQGYGQYRKQTLVQVGETHAVFTTIVDTAHYDSNSRHPGDVLSLRDRDQMSRS
ncbi:hypothetical protein FA15DRAFT_758872 [Coprinopsis marcescibilis]|uniref:DUF6533 domain-containing protein n=1 Tax=Coprinopsis marcescibilis TaxID=230819 RepID=A0A5C3KM87_COPMA|nr:hypothetical protein FA15DRAFT_758872 [Coprinopsis marcescibilis]